MEDEGQQGVRRGKRKCRTVLLRSIKKPRERVDERKCICIDGCVRACMCVAPGIYPSLDEEKKKRWSNDAYVCFRWAKGHHPFLLKRSPQAKSNN